MADVMQLGSNVSKRHSEELSSDFPVVDGTFGNRYRGIGIVLLRYVPIGSLGRAAFCALQDVGAAREVGRGSAQRPGSSTRLMS